jgi:hypothetical protein
MTSKTVIHFSHFQISIKKLKTKMKQNIKTQVFLYTGLHEITFY